MSSLSYPVPVAVIDDYLNLSTPYFSRIPSSKARILTFTDALPPYSHNSTAPAQRAEIVERYRPFAVLCTMRERTPFPHELLKQLPNLKLLLCTGTQFNTFDIRAAKELGITVATVHGKRRRREGEKGSDITKGAAHPTVQHTWALILALTRNIASDDYALKHTGGWQTATATGLTGKTLGIVGLGRLGAAVARVGFLCWGMQVLCWSANLTQERADALAESVGLPTEGAEKGQKTFRCVDKDELFAASDVVSVHYQLSPRSEGLIGARELARMKNTALLVNASRGPLIQEQPLLDVLQRGAIGGAALDVFDVEPLPEDSPWRTISWGLQGRSKVLLTPHMGYVDEDNMAAWYAEQAEELEKWLDGGELSIVL